ncbi:unnamed protein product [Trifolium pratense]|uniref:Uncharacterized protein n=1 Tax=Trifolium pratense TaxID=57577 RepID=A0ACB0JPE3_TRIPR|nr:unnamed protein product [Trifolium pratense]
MEENLELFNNDTNPHYFFMKKEVIKSRNKDLVQLFEFGMGIHHAMMLRSDRGLTERLFSHGLLKAELISLVFNLDFRNLPLVSLSMHCGAFRYLSAQQL